ncbi:ABC transporter permease [Streptomyces sp. NBC_00654]|uniref:ABC transporter permease n=1 Tax=Streptomyces sp. NBC_00654 TaxID=2975799 RepID=UPI0022548DD1|nr:ABC transporter permease [Streptomyces sp. NBC_00654]MCX4970342.1 ABC transporter permease [Streptomyces sp. NBC_00654]
MSTLTRHEPGKPGKPGAPGTHADEARTGAPGGARVDGPLSGPVRVLLRVHRRPLWTAGALLLLGIGAVVALRIWVAAASGQERCPDGDITACGDDVYQPTYARTSAETFLADGGNVTLLLAGLLGILVAGPLIARELESGTFRMAWTQSVAPSRWLTVRIAVPVVLATAATAVVVPVYRWGWTGLQHNPFSWGLRWYEGSVYLGSGPVTLGYALLAVALGALVAVLVRRTLPAMGITALLVGAVAVTLTQLREHLWPVARLSGKRGPDDFAWFIDSGMLTASGRAVYWNDCAGAGTPGGDLSVCMRERGGVTPFTDVHPASHFWPLQLVETGILLAVAALAVFAAFRVLRRLHG